MKKQDNHQSNSNRDVTLENDLWTHGLICAFEFVRGCKQIQTTQIGFGKNDCDPDHRSGPFHAKEGVSRSCWAPIGWSRITELVQTVQVDDGWALQPMDSDEEDGAAVADVAAPYHEQPVGPIWWCHVAAGHPFIHSWLSTAKWLHPAISIALRDESRLISERMKHLFYEVNSCSL